MNDKILTCIYSAIDEANEDRNRQRPLEKSPKTQIHGSTDALDSLGLVNFVVAVEEGIERETGASIVLSDDRSLSQDPSPFASVETLARYIERLVREQT